jgi:hypothetical protein
MIDAAIAPGSVVWLALAAGIVTWLALLALKPGAFLGPRRLLRWILTSWLPRILAIVAWGAAGWHVFCQRP